MYHHVKKLMYTVRVDDPIPASATCCSNSSAVPTASSRRRCSIPFRASIARIAERKDLLMDIGTEELSHLEIVGCLARMHLKPMKFVRDAAEADPLIAIAGGGGVNLFNSMGNPWTADYLKITGELDVDLRSNIAAEARAKIVYERLINFCNDAGTKDALQFLMTREITHMKAFAAALESMGKPRFVIGRIAPPPGLWISSSTTRPARATMARSTLEDRGTRATLGNSSKRRPSRTFDKICQRRPAIHAESSDLVDVEPIQELLVDQLRDILHAEKQLLKALPKMAKSARSAQLQRLFQVHLQETETQVERLNKSLSILGAPARAKPCKGMMGLVEEGQEVMEEGKKKDDAAADLALIGAAQRVEHYEIAGYTTAKNLAQQLHHSAVVQLLAMSLAEEENADQLLNQVARPLMAAARMPAPVA